MPISSQPFNSRVIRAIQSTTIYRDYQSAFRLATGMSLFLRATDNTITLTEERTEQNPFCQALCAGAGCEECQRQHELLKSQGHAAEGFCFARMKETAVPITSAGQPIAWLWTGQVFVDIHPRGEFGDVADMLRAHAFPVKDMAALQKLWEQTPTVGSEKYAAVKTLLEIFAKQLSSQIEQLLQMGSPSEPETITKARRVIRQRFAEVLTLEEVAQSAGLSPHYFSRQFHEVTGLRFVEYVNRVRVEAARRVLLKPRARISEVALDVGYQSLSQFNRAFRTITGESPSEFRSRMTHDKRVGTQN